MFTHENVLWEVLEHSKRAVRNLFVNSLKKANLPGTNLAAFLKYGGFDQVNLTLRVVT
jgi:hypothetical protein